MRNRFRDLHRRVEEREEADEQNLEEARKASELAWKGLAHALHDLFDRAAVAGARRR